MHLWMNQASAICLCTRFILEILFE